MTQFHSLRRRVAAVLFNEGGKNADDFHALPKDRQAPWLADADRVIPIVIEACAGVADARDPVSSGAFTRYAGWRFPPRPTAAGF